MQFVQVEHMLRDAFRGRYDAAMASHIGREAISIDNTAASITPLDTPPTPQRFVQLYDRRVMQL